MKLSKLEIELRRKEIEKLKEDWLKDPCWDLSAPQELLTEAENKELAAFQKKWEDQWKNDGLIATVKKAEELGCSPQLARYIMNQNETIKTLIEKVEKLSDKIEAMENRGKRLR